MTRKKYLELDVPYFSQLNNETKYHGSGSRQCNLTSNAMLLAYLRPELMKKYKQRGYFELESWYGRVLARYGDTTDHGANTQALKEFQIDSEFRYDLSIDILINSLSKGFPVVMGMAYKSSGHIVIATGYDLNKNHIFIHDPYGVRYGSSNSYNIGARAEDDPHSFNLLRRIWVDMGANAGWGRIVKSVKNKPTGL